MLYRRNHKVTLSQCHLATVSAILSLAVAAVAQVTPTEAPTIPAPEPTVQAAESALEAAPQPTVPPTPPPFSTTRPATTLSATVKFNFTDAPLDSVVNFLSDSFGFTIIKKVRLEGRITTSRLQPVGADEAVDIINSLLKDYSFGILRTGMVLRVDTLENIRTQNIPVNFGNDPEKIQPSDTLITQIIPISSMDAVRLRQDLSSMFSPNATVVANAASNTLVITDTAASIRKIVEVVSAMDKQLGTASEIKVFKLKYANAAAAARLITDTFRDTTGGQTGGSTRGGSQRGGTQRGGTFITGGGPGGAFANMMNALNQQQGTGARAGTVIASSDDRTNTVVVTAPPETLKIIEEQIITKLDSDPAENSTTFVYAMKNASAVNLQGVLNSFFSTGGGSTATNTRANTGFTGLNINQMSSSSSNRTSTTGARTGGSFGSVSSRNSSGISSAASDLIGQAYVVAEPDTNSLLVTVKTPYKDNIIELLKTLDRDIPQVLIKVLVCEVTHTNSSDMGVEWSVLFQRDNGRGTIGGTDFSVARSLATAAATGTPSGLVASVVETNIAAALKALASTGKLDVLSRPSILASDNQLASILVGQLVPYIRTSNTTQWGINNVADYNTVGISLNVTPHINPDGLVILDVQPQVSQLNAQTVTIQPGVDINIIDIRQAQSRVAIRNGETIIIGGLMRDNKTQSVDKVPFLGDIPLLGELFKRTVENKEKTELLIFITPQVAASPDMLPAMSKDEGSGTKLVPNAVAPGTFDEHIQGMNRGHMPTPPLPDMLKTNTSPTSTPPQNTPTPNP